MRYLILIYEQNSANPSPASAYQAALELTTNEVERAFLTRRIHELETARPN